MTLMLSKAVDAGNTPGGRRMVAEITSATASGRLSGSVAGGGSADWFTMTAGGLILPVCGLGCPSSVGLAEWVRTQLNETRAESDR